MIIEPILLNLVNFLQFWLNLFIEFVIFVQFYFVIIYDLLVILLDLYQLYFFIFPLYYFLLGWQVMNYPLFSFSIFYIDLYYISFVFLLGSLSFRLVILLEAQIIIFQDVSIIINFRTKVKFNQVIKDVDISLYLLKNFFILYYCSSFNLFVWIKVKLNLILIFKNIVSSIFQNTKNMIRIYLRKFYFQNSLLLIYQKLYFNILQFYSMILNLCSFFHYLMRIEDIFGISFNVIKQIMKKYKLLQHVDFI